MSTKSELMVLLKSTRFVHIVISYIYICDEFRPIVLNVRSRSVCDDMTTIEVDKFSMLLFLAIDISLLITCTHPYFLFFPYSLVTHSLSTCRCCANALVGTILRTE